jgi:hypothetical protein
MADKPIEVLLKEGRSFPPPRSFKKSAHAKSATFNSARKNPQAFWAKAAKGLEWSSHGEGLDRLAMFYDVYVTRPELQRRSYSLLPF